MKNGRGHFAKYVVVSGTAASIGREIMSRHRTKMGAARAASRSGGTVEPAELFLLVRGGMSHTEAVQRLAGREIRSVLVP